MHRASGRRFFALTKVKEAYKANVEGIRNQQLSARNKIWGQAAFAPVPDLAPPPPRLEPQTAGRGLFLAGLSGLMSGFGVYNQYKAGGTNMPNWFKSGG